MFQSAEDPHQRSEPSSLRGIEEGQPKSQKPASGRGPGVEGERGQGVVAPGGRPGGTENFGARPGSRYRWARCSPSACVVDAPAAGLPAKRNPCGGIGQSREGLKFEACRESHVAHADVSRLSSCGRGTFPAAGLVPLSSIFFFFFVLRVLS
ncbi:hypothetical protein CPLU01_09648 [Colletotrichum plurivorum]|uniref:Uncharacterized protein n=1 Tax=Colletotrichum plurivorum TaxID=2175906 RepID=A0A8H6K7G8_9PEZI|nr:hypothetical protein CPLU01_09648 [Colletotrichum plurivorum]